MFLTTVLHACVSACQPRIELSDKKEVVCQRRGLILHSDPLTTSANFAQISARHQPLLLHCLCFGMNQLAPKRSVRAGKQII